MEKVAQKVDYIHLPENTMMKNGEYRILNRVTDKSNLSVVYYALKNDNTDNTGTDGYMEEIGYEEKISYEEKIGYDKRANSIKENIVIIKEFFPSNMVLRDINGIDLVCKNTNYHSRYQEAKERFRKESDILKEFLGSRNICKYIDYFQENNTAYLVMEYYPGKTLTEYILNQTMEFSLFVENIFYPVLKAVQSMHKRGYIHRDLKPDNIIIFNNEPVIIDFGSSINYRKEIKKKILLTPGFSPIEFYSEKAEQGPYSDIYSLAAILYFVLSGSIPPEANERIIEDRMGSLNNIVTDSLLGFDEIIMKNLSLKARERCQSIRAFKFFMNKNYLRYKLGKIIF